MHLNDCPEELLSDEYIKFDDIHVISAKNSINVDSVKQSIRDVLDKYAEERLNKEIEEKLKQSNSTQDTQTKLQSNIVE